MRFPLWALLLLAGGCLDGSTPEGPSDAPGDFHCRALDTALEVGAADPTAAQAGPDEADEVWHVWVNRTGPMNVLVPLLLSSPEPDAAAWMANLSLRNATATLWSGPEGQAVELNGTAPAEACSHSRQPAASGGSCCAERYLNGAWSFRVATPAPSREQSLPVLVLNGRVDVAITYAAQSHWCGRYAHFEAWNIGPSWAELPGRDSSVCQ